MLRSDILLHVRKYIELAASRLSTKRYEQENAYVNAFIGKLDGVIDLGEESGSIDLRCTIINSNGPGAAERKFGADFALCFESMGAKKTVKKAIIAQAKRGRIDKISKSEKERLEAQCQKMSMYTQHYLCLETPTIDGSVPFVMLGAPQSGGLKSDRIRFDEYIVDYIISCAHGDRAESFIDAVSFSNLTKLKITSENLTFEPDYSLNNDPGPDF